MKKTILLGLATALAVGTAIAEDTIVIKGSDTLGAKMVPQLAEEYKSAHPDVSFEIAAEGSSTAFTNLLAGTADIGMSSRDAKEEEKNDFTAKGEELMEYIGGVDMIALIVNEDNSLEELTMAQIEGIFTGDITDWSEIDPTLSGEISVYTRNTSSGTYKTFQDLGMNKRDYGAATQKMAGNEQIAQEVGKNKNGIGYVGLAYLGADGIKGAAVDGVTPEPANALEYPLARNLYYYTAGKPEAAAADFLKWATTDEAAGEIVEKVGFIAPPQG